MQWYYSKNGNQLGPISAEEIKAKLASGEIAATDLVWKDGMGDWIPAAQVGELRSAVAPVSTAPPAPTGAAASPYSPPVSSPVAPVGPGGVALPPTSGKATTAMVLGICGLVFALCCPLVGLVLGILAVVFGNQAKEQIAQNPQWGADLGKAKNAVIMGWVAIPLAVVVGIVGVVIQFSSAALHTNVPQ